MPRGLGSGGARGAPRGPVGGGRGTPLGPEGGAGGAAFMASFALDTLPAEALA